MYSIIGLLRKAEGQSVEEFRAWWLEHHAPLVAKTPGLRDYRVWTTDESLDQRSLSFTCPAPYDGIAVMTFDSKEDFEALMASSAGTANNDSFNEGAPQSTVLGGQQYIIVQ